VARRIVLAVLALVAAVLAVVAVPLGLITAHQDAHDFRDETIAAASTLANVAEEQLGDHSGAAAMSRTVRQFAAAGDQVSVTDLTGRRIAASPVPPAASAAQLRQAMATDQTMTYQRGDRFVVIQPVRSDSGRGAIGVVVLARLATAINERVAVLWAVIAAVATVGLLAAALVAVALARWVSRPLRELDGAARAFGDGNLGTRSPDTAGPAEVRSLAASFNQMAGRLEALVRRHQVTMADVSHQLRTPLAALRLRLDLLAQDSDAEAAAELAGAQEEIARLSRLVNGLLAVARAENVDTPQVYQSVDETIRTRIAVWQPTADEREVTMVGDLEPVGARMGDGQLEQILDNLIANALDVLRPGGTIRLAALAEGDKARIVVADNGPGMSPAQQRAAFRRFASGSAGGTGLGLAIVDRLTVSNGGSARLSDTPGGGLTVTIELRLARRDRRSGRGLGATGSSEKSDSTGEHRYRRPAPAAQSHPRD